MLLAPARWFARVPGVPAPFNAHFVRDIGIAYLVAGVGIAGLAWRERARPDALAGAAFLALHALLHAVEAASHAGGLTELVRDLPTVHAPAVAALWLALSRHETRPARRSAP
jgi:hypothetical protein